MPFQLHQNYGMIFRHQKDFGRSLEHFEAAVDILGNANMPYYLGSACFEMGLMFRDMGESGKARELLGRAEEILSKVGAEKFSKKVQDELRRLEEEAQGAGLKAQGGEGQGADDKAKGDNGETPSSLAPCALRPAPSDKGGGQ